MATYYIGVGVAGDPHVRQCRKTTKATMDAAIAEAHAWLRTKIVCDSHETRWNMFYVSRQDDPSRPTRRVAAGDAEGVRATWPFEP